MPNPRYEEIPVGAGAISDGSTNVTTSGTPVKVLSSSTPCQNLIICAKTTNTGIISVGTSDVVAAASTRKGIPLSPGDSLSIAISDVSLVYIDATVNGEGVTYIYTT